MKTIEKMSRAFKLYRILKERSDSYVDSRLNGLFGIACNTDHYAIKWQKLQFRLHVIECYLLNEPINWHHASWLTYEQKEERNAKYKK